MIFSRITTICVCLLVHVSARHAMVIIDPYSANILKGKHPHSRMYPASLTKMMTMCLLLEAVQNRVVSLNTPFVASAYACSQPPSRWGLKLGQTLTVRECLSLLLVRSANDVAVMVAENLAGSVARFVKQMNHKARVWAMYNTRFQNPTGWHHPHQYSSAYDMALLIRALWNQYPKHRRLLSQASFTHPRGTFRHTNILQGKVSGMMMSKTGYTGPAGWNLAVMMEPKQKNPAIIVIMKMDSARKRADYMLNIIHALYKIKPAQTPAHKPRSRVYLTKAFKQKDLALKMKKKKSVSKARINFVKVKTKRHLSRQMAKNSFLRKN